MASWAATPCHPCDAHSDPRNPPRNRPQGISIDDSHHCGNLVGGRPATQNQVTKRAGTLAQKFGVATAVDGVGDARHSHAGHDLK